MTPRALLLACVVLFAGPVAPLAAPAAAAHGGGASVAGMDPASGGSTPPGPAPGGPGGARDGDSADGGSADSGTAAGNTTGAGNASAPSAAELASSYEVDVRGGTLPADYPLVFARVARLVGRPGVSPPSEVVVHSSDRMADAVGSQSLPTFVRALGIRPADEGGQGGPTETPAAYVSSPRRVNVNERILNDSARTETTLAHESVHVIQFRTGSTRGLGRAAASPGSAEAGLLRTALVEGAATYVQGEYNDRYLPAAESTTASLEREARNASGAGKLGLVRYLAGARYVEARIDDPRELRSVYRRPPRTTEELLHGLAPGSEPVADVSVADAPGDGWTAEPASRNTFGELFLRTVLWTELNRSAAVAGADGWGGDARLGFRSAADAPVGGFAWAVRFDDAANATEFEAAFAEWSAGREPGEAPVRAVRAAPETVVVFVGGDRFVESATARGTNGTVTVELGA